MVTKLILLGCITFVQVSVVTEKTFRGDFKPTARLFFNKIALLQMSYLIHSIAN